MQIKHVEFRNKQGNALVGIVHAPADKGKFPFIVLAHSLGSSKAGKEEWCERFSARGMASLRFDFSGHGESSSLDDATFSKFVDDHIAAANFARAHRLCNGKVALCGHSLGGATSLAAAVEAKATAIAAISSFYDYKVLLRRLQKDIKGIEDLKKKFNMSNKFAVSPRAIFKIYTDLMRFDMKSRIAAIRCPTLIVHGSEDEIVPPEEAQRIFNDLQCDKRIEIMGGSGHLFLREEEKKQLFIVTSDWLGSILLH